MLEGILEGQMAPQYFPVQTLKNMGWMAPKHFWPTRQCHKRK